MPLGKIHRKRNKTVLIAVSIISLLFFFKFPYIAWLPLGLAFNTYFADPDQDVRGKGVWLIYNILLPHRHPLSHWPVLATAIKNLYLFVLILPIYVILECLHPVNISKEIFKLIQLNTSAISLFFLGQNVADGLHFVFDYEGTHKKKVRRNYGVR